MITINYHSQNGKTTGKTRATTVGADLVSARTKGDIRIDVKEQSLTDELMAFFAENYQFRRNILTGNVEFCERESADWQPVTKYAFNTIVIKAQRQGIKAWDRDVKRYIESDFVKTYCPLTDYLHGLRGKWDGADRIQALAARVPNRNRRWPELFHRWMLSVVAQWLGRNTEHGATMVPLLVGAQGDGKSTFCRQLMPPRFRGLYSDRLDFSNKKEAERALSAFALINIDEFDSITKSQTAFLKHILQKTSVISRDPYALSFTDHRRYAAFIATTNCPAPLTDPTGSRRYLCVRTTGQIDCATSIDYEQVYAQLVTELESGERAFFDSTDEAYIQRRNREFQQCDPLEEVFTKLFRKPKKDGDGVWMKTSDIVSYMHKRNKAVKENHSTVVRTGLMLSRLCYRTHRKENGCGYYVEPRKMK